MLLSCTLDCWANLSALLDLILTLIAAGVGVFGYLDFRCKWIAKKKALISYLRDKKVNSPVGARGQHTALHLVRHVGLTEDEILKISFEDKRVRRSVGADQDGRAEVLYFEYSE